MTLFGIDVSNHQGNFDFARARSEGMVFATHKISEGSGYRDPYWPRAKAEMQKWFPGRWGGYVFCRRASDPAAEARTLASHAGSTDFPLQIDYEDTSGGGNYNDLVARINAYKAVGFKTFLPIYLPRWFWSGHMGSPNLANLPVDVGIWNSHYVNGSGLPAALYPGDAHAGWADMGNRRIDLLQFTENAGVAGQSIDANAFRGTGQQFNEMFGGAMSKADEELGKKFPSRSKYRANDDLVDTLAGFVLNIDARIHETWVEDQARQGVDWCLDLVKREAAKGDKGSQAVLDSIGK
jgi:hypothetical protein